MIDFGRERFLPLTLGKLVATPGALEELRKCGVTPLSLVIRHASGDWGDTHEEDAGLNDEALINGDRILSVYKLTDEVTIWIITEWDRSVTTILLPSEY